MTLITKIKITLLVMWGMAVGAAWPVMIFTTPWGGLQSGMYALNCVSFIFLTVATAGLIILFVIQVFAIHWDD